ncbi:hypothetical protein Patl1_21842 [Pistacia atlantica]|uniref:Uncharacterized protein n=1 Tax=Pistacia atlantica TaxID=434234 RepID=A0ACC1BLZ2_9ROSI|nr:hypothetical protein Patl1_21842 [Pistacia atlantica]
MRVAMSKTFIKNITKGGRDVYQLLEPRPYYFLSGRGFCWGGMKLVIMVQNPASMIAPCSSQKSLTDKEF